MARLKLTVFFLLLFICGAKAQYNWEARAWSFIDSLKKYSSYEDNALKSLLTITDSLVVSVCDSCSKSTLAYVYEIKADICEEVLKRRPAAADERLFALENARLITEIESYYRKALSYDADCKCDVLYKLRDFYDSYGSPAEYEKANSEAKEAGVPLDYFFVGVDLNYVAPKNIVSGEVGIMFATTVRQPKKAVRPDGTKYRQCPYEYPKAVGLLFVGYERSLDNSNYKAVKFNPVWVNYIFSIHPLQFLLASTDTKKSFVYRPELGLSFSSFAIAYAVNLPVNSSFTFLPKNNVSVRICIPAIPIFRK